MDKPESPQSRTAAVWAVIWDCRTAMAFTKSEVRTMASYICIDLKSFYASVECVDRGLDPLNTNLVVADTG